MTDAGAIAATRAAANGVADAELEALLDRVYVQGGFTPPDAARTLFEARSVRARGQLLVVRDPTSDALAGMVIVVPPTSPARKLAASDEAEMHLLAVLPEQRGRGIGATLIAAATAAAKQDGWARMVLWTQPAMTSAQKLYRAAGFERVPAREQRIAELTGRPFLVFEKQL